MSHPTNKGLDIEDLAEHMGTHFEDSQEKISFPSRSGAEKQHWPTPAKAKWIDR